MAINYLTSKDLIDIHFLVMEDDEDISILNQNQLEYTLDRIKWTHYDRYEDFFDKCVILFRDIISGHIFVDGNKRTGFATLYRFLEINGYEIKTELNDKKENESFFSKIKEKLKKFISFIPKYAERQFSFIWEFVIRVASEEVPLSEIKNWIIKISKKI